MMTLSELREANVARDKEWDPEKKIDLGFRAAEIGGEVGELLNCLKKKMREELGLVGSRTTIEAIRDELADVLICVDLLAMQLDVDLEVAVRTKFNKTSRERGLQVML